MAIKSNYNSGTIDMTDNLNNLTNINNEWEMLTFGNIGYGSSVQIPNTYNNVLIYFYPADSSVVRTGSMYTLSKSMFSLDIVIQWNITNASYYCGGTICVNNNNNNNNNNIIISFQDRNNSGGQLNTIAYIIWGK